MRRLSVLTVTRNRSRRSSSTGCSATEAAIPVWTLLVGHSSSGTRRSRTSWASGPSTGAVRADGRCRPRRARRGRAARRGTPAAPRGCSAARSPRRRAPCTGCPPGARRRTPRGAGPAGSPPRRRPGRSRRRPPAGSARPAPATSSARARRRIAVSSVPTRSRRPAQPCRKPSSTASTAASASGPARRAAPGRSAPRRARPRRRRGPRRTRGRRAPARPRLQHADRVAERLEVAGQRARRRDVRNHRPSASGSVVGSACPAASASSTTVAGRSPPSRWSCSSTFGAARDLLRRRHA